MVIVDKDLPSADYRNYCIHSMEKQLGWVFMDFVEFLIKLVIFS